MNLATLDVDRDVARKAFLEYRDSIRAQRADEVLEEERALMRSYRELSRGAQVIDLAATLRSGGLVNKTFATTTYREGKQQRVYHEGNVPVLSIGRADQTETRITASEDQARAGTIEYHLTPIAGTWDARSDNGTLRFDGIFPGLNLPPSTIASRLSSAVPSVPAPLRPKAHLRNYHVLYEAVWEYHPGCGDPALLKSLGGNLYAVVAVWDLTDLERAALGGRR